jgi:hypothetical protein
MDLSDYLWMFVKSYNPNQYARLLEHSLRHFFSFVGLIILSCLFLFSLLMVPITYNYIDSIPARTANIERLTLDAEAVAAEPVTLLERPQIVLHLDANQTRSGDITLSNDGILYPKYLFFGTQQLAWSEVKDLKQPTQGRDRMITAAIVFLLPSIIFWFFLYSLLKTTIIVALLLLLGYSLPRIFKHKISGKDTFKLVLLTLPSLLIMDLALYPLAPLFWWGLLLTAVLFFVGVAIVSEVEGTHKQKV